MQLQVYPDRSIGYFLSFNRIQKKEWLDGGEENGLPHTQTQVLTQFFFIYFKLELIWCKFSETAAIPLPESVSQPPGNKISGTFIPADLFLWEEPGHMTHSGKEVTSWIGAVWSRPQAKRGTLSIQAYKQIQPCTSFKRWKMQQHICDVVHQQNEFSLF